MTELTDPPEQQPSISLGSRQNPLAVAPTAYILAAYKQMLISLFASSLIIIIAFFIAFWGLISDLEGSESSPSPVLISVLAGSLGAVFSSLIRLYNFTDLPEAVLRAELKDLGSPYLFIYSAVPIVVGAIAAAVIYVIFASGIVEGALFPKFICKPNPDACTDFVHLVRNWSPQKATDYARIIIWGFAAGFAERLVPNTMDSLSSGLRVKT